LLASTDILETKSAPEGGIPMADEARHQAIRSALSKAVKGTPLALFEHLIPVGDTTSGSLRTELDDGSKVVFERRITGVQTTKAFRRTEDGGNPPLEDGEYKLKGGVPFHVVDGRIDFDALLDALVADDPHPQFPFKEYHAWPEVVAIGNPLHSLADPLSVTDVVRFLAPDGNSYYAVQQGLNRPYQAYIVADHALRPLADGDYPLAADRSFKVESGDVQDASLSDVKIFAYQSSRLPR
jgi:hypothetical protein